MKRKCDVIQLSLFDNDYRDKTDNQLISDLTNKVDMVSDLSLIHISEPTRP